MLELDLATIAFQILNFLILAAGLYFLLFKPVMKTMRERAETKAQLMQDLQNDKAAAASLQAELEARLAGVEEEVTNIVNEAREKAGAERIEILQEAQTEVEQILERAHVDAYRLKRQTINEFYDDLLDTVLDVSNQMIRRVSPHSAHDAMVQQLLDSVWELGRTDMRQVEVLREGLGDRTPNVVTVTARALTTEQQGQLVRTFSALADRNINLDLSVEPALGLGLRVRIGDLVMENSIAHQLSELKEIVGQALVEQFEHE
jgi:F0F1-type ATP synthase membrane subunit b/b'